VKTIFQCETLTDKGFPFFGMDDSLFCSVTNEECVDRMKLNEMKTSTEKWADYKWLAADSSFGR
jgi:hypothetical protein